MRSFERVATYDVPGQVAEIVASTPDGRPDLYRFRLRGNRLRQHHRPEASYQRWIAGDAGEPTSVAVTPDGAWALVVVHESKHDALVVVDLGDSDHRYHDCARWSAGLGRHERDGRYAAIAIENERDEDVNDGAMPQPPRGS